MFTRGNTPVVWRGPMLHRALQQFLADVYWGDLDVLLLDLPPGTGDVAISVAQMLPTAELLVVTTPQLADADPSADHRGHREHVLPGLRALRGAYRGLRFRRRRHRRARPDPDHRDAGAVARSGAARRPAARRRRRRGSARARRTGLPRRACAAEDRRRTRRPRPRPGRPPARAHAALSACLILSSLVSGLSSRTNRGGCCSSSAGTSRAPGCG